MKFLSKRNILLSIFTLVGVLILENQYFHFYYCSVTTSCYYESYGQIREILLPILKLTILLLLPVLLTLPFKTSVFEAWRHNAVVSIPVILLIYLWLLGKGTDGGFYSNLPDIIFVGIPSLIYVVTSFIIIGISWYKTQEKISFSPVLLANKGRKIILGFVIAMFIIYWIIK